MTSANHRRAVERSPWPVSAHQTRLPPRPAKNEPVKPRRRKPSSGERAAADANQPSRHREFARAIPAAAIPDAGAGGAMGREVEFLPWIVRSVEMLMVHALQPCKIPRSALAAKSR